MARVQMRRSASVHIIILIEGCALSSSPPPPPPPLSSSFWSDLRCATILIHWWNGTYDDLGLIQYSGDCNLMHTITADTSGHQRTCTILFFKILFRIDQSFALLQCCSLWGKCGAHSLFLRRIFIVMFWLAKVLEWLVAQNPVLWLQCLFI